MTSLSSKDKAMVKAFWAKVKANLDMIGGEALKRMLIVYPQTKIYFAHWKDLSPKSPILKEHGKVIMLAVNDAVANIDNLTESLLDLSELHAFKLRVDPANFKLLYHNMLVVMAILLPKDFTPEVHVAMDKFLEAMALGLSERYR